MEDILNKILEMPVEYWQDDPFLIQNRYERYVEASKKLKSQDLKLDNLLKIIMENNKIKMEIIRLWKNGKSLEEIEKTLKVIVEVPCDDDWVSISEDIEYGNFEVKQILNG